MYTTIFHHDVERVTISPARQDREGGGWARSIVIKTTYGCSLRLHLFADCAEATLPKLEHENGEGAA